MTFRFVASSILIAVVILFSSCGSEKDDHQVVILCALAMDENCAVSDDPEHCLSTGMLDLNHPGFSGEPVYYLHPLILNHSAYTDVQIKNAVLSYEWQRGRDILKNRYDLRSLLEIENGSFSIYWSDVVSANSQEFFDFLEHLRSIPPDVGKQLSLLGDDSDKFTLGVSISVRAEAPDGTMIKSNELLFPIELCWGCLSGVCPDGSYPSCTPGQDGHFLSCM